MGQKVNIQLANFDMASFACYLVSSGNAVANCVWLAVPEPTKWQRIGNQIDAAMIFARADFVNVHGAARRSDWSIIHLSLVHETSLEAWLSAVPD